MKTTLTFGEQRQLQRVWAKAMRIDAKKPDDTSFDGSAVYDAQDLAVKLLVQKLVLPDGTELTEPEKIFTAINAFEHEEDGRLIYQKIDEATASTTALAQKKGA